MILSKTKKLHFYVVLIIIVKIISKNSFFNVKLWLKAYIIITMPVPLSWKFNALSGKIISHIGTILSVKDNHVRVNILSKSACSSCHAKGSCNVSDTSEKIIDVTDSRTFSVGEQVEVLFSGNTGMKAVLFGYFFPFLFMVMSLIVSLSFFENELFAGLITIGSLMIYYLILMTFRSKLKRIFTFSIRKYE